MVSHRFGEKRDTLREGMQRARRYAVIDAGDAAIVPFAPLVSCKRSRGNDPIERQVSAGLSTKDLDRAVRAGIARITGGLAPSALAGAFFDWAVHVVSSPGKQLELAGQAINAAVQNLGFAARCSDGAAHDPCHCALPQDNRFRAAEWQRFPFNEHVGKL